MAYAPGIRILERVTGPAPAVGLPSAQAGAVGPASWGPINMPLRTSSWPEWVRKFGGLEANIQATFDIYAAYLQGMRDLIFVRVADGTEAKAEVTLQDRAATPQPTLKVTAKYPGTLGNRLSVQMLDATLDPANKFRLRVLLDGEPLSGEDFNELTVGANGNVAEKINGVSEYIEVTDLNSATSAPNNRPATGTFSLTGGADGASPSDSDYVGTTDINGNRTGLQALIPYVDELGLVFIPSVTTTTVQGALLQFAEQYYFPLALLDGSGSGDSEVETHRNNLGQSSFGAYYYPRPFIRNPLTGADKYVSMAAVMAGYIARVDASRREGPAKAPANDPPFYPTILGLERKLDEGQVGRFNEMGINCAVAFRNRGIRMWGARTLSYDLRFRYITSRRIFQYAARALKQAFLDVPFEPNYVGLWDSIKRSARGLLDSMVRDGMLEGPEGVGYAVICDETNNPPESRAAGNLYIDIGLADVKPAEFVWLRFSKHETGTITVQETQQGA